MTARARQAPDLSKAQFLAALKRNGMRATGFMGYVEVGGGTSVCRFNAGDRLRDQLAYLLAQQDKANALHAKAGAA